MAKIEMDVNNCNLIHSRMSKISAEFASTIDAQEAKITEGVDANWKSASASEFIKEINTLVWDLRKEVRDFDFLVGKLRKAIDAHTQVDENFG